ncbi:MAG: carbohydrate kinase family protein [Gammaproteobacteria bacterium]
MYESDGRRRSPPRNAGLLDSVGDGAASGDPTYLDHLRTISPSWEDVPRSWHAAAMHVAPQVLERHARTLSAAKRTMPFVSVNPSPHYSRGLDVCGIARAVAGTTALLPSEQEIRHLVTGEADIGSWKALAMSLVGQGLPEAAIKLGSRGAVAANAGGVEHIPPAEAHPVDVTGAGDAFCGAYAACRILGHTRKKPRGKPVSRELARLSARVLVAYCAWGSCTARDGRAGVFLGDDERMFDNSDGRRQRSRNG